MRLAAGLKDNGVQDVTRRVARRVERGIAARFRTGELDFPLLPGDIADSRRNASLIRPPARSSGPLRVAWLCTPPSPGSGGHTTLFRMVEGLESRGHRCTILMYNRHGSSLAQHAAVIRQHWPNVKAEIAYVPERITGYDACVASSWETAHVLAARSENDQHHFYFVQDYEPYFYPRGSLYALAEDTYRFGFSLIAIGHMVHDLLWSEAGADSVVAPFGCDTDVYSLENSQPRSGVVFYARPGAERRGFELAMLALAEFHRRQPEQPIRIFGDSVPGWDIPHSHLGKLSPAGLNALYNRSAAGLAMSFTNVSLVAEEMLAAGMQPVVNDSPLVRADLDNGNVAWAMPTPQGIAEALCLAVQVPQSASVLAARAASVHRGWGAAQGVVAGHIKSTCAGLTTTGGSDAGNRSLGATHHGH